MLLLLLGCLWCLPVQARAPVPLFGPSPTELPLTIYPAAANDAPPTDFTALASWLMPRHPLPRVNMLGGDYWLVAPLPPVSSTQDGVVAFNNTWYRRATLQVLGDDGSMQAFSAVRGSGGDPMLHGTGPVRLQAGHRYVAVVRVTTPFFSAPPRIDLQTAEQHHRRLANESALMFLSLGVLGGLGVFILFVGVWTRSLSYALYGCQALVLMAGWAAFFGLPEDWLGLPDGRLNFTLWFILVPVVHAPFAVRFLELGKHAPRAARLGYAIALASVLALPVAVALPSLAFLIATAAITLVVLFSASVSVWALAHGVRQARFFALAYVCVVLPGLVILPVNFGLMPSPVDNADLLTLIGNSCEAMLLAFALADHVKLVQAARERFRQGMLDAVARASTDPLTGLGNRLAFNMRIEEITRDNDAALTRGAWQVAMIDLDGLKQINDSEGHDRGDALLQAAGHGLARLPGHGRAFRLGGDEFAVIAFGDEMGLHRLTRSLVRLDRQLRQQGFASAGLSFGVCGAADGQQLNDAEFAELVRRADRMMYEYKSQRRSSAPDAAEEALDTAREPRAEKRGSED
ncbi:diguanylate cyclase [Dyella sp. C9]|uniref:GGDEF domain-containing protein n=1 Tax=Dyella sp. C9 TaxID=2202154 RepID=UPI00130081DF|nr:diguanylate cyclase [Dyella sp. C9]